MKEIKNKKNNEAIFSLKGMFDHFDETYYKYQGFFEKAQEVAVYYGFKPLDTPCLEKEELFVRGVGENTDIIDKEIYNFKTKGGDKVCLRPEWTASVMRSYLENGMMNLPQPVMLYSYGNVWRHDNPQKGRLREIKQFNLEIIGSEKSICEAIVIQTSVNILKEYGLKDIVVDINSLGNKDDRKNYIKELVSYYKKNISKMCSDCKNRIHTNPIKLLDCKNNLCQTYKEFAPSSINFLSTESKKHFREVIQYLEEMKIDYKINNCLVRGLNYYSHTVFEIVRTIQEEKENGEILEKEITILGGGRYDYLAKEIGSKKEIPAIGASIGFDRILLLKDCNHLLPKIIKKPKFYFLQLGFEAKLKSLQIMEILRENKIPVYQNISKDTLSNQLAKASESNIPYCIIFGQKEAIDGTMIIKNMKNHSQQIIKIEKLAEYLKKLK